MAGVPDADGTKRVIDGRPEAIRRNCEDSLRRLQTDVIDLYYLHRWDKQRADRGQRRRAGRPGARGQGPRASACPRCRPRRCGARTRCIRSPRVQTEYSLWTRNPEIAVLDACRELGVGVRRVQPARARLPDRALRDVSRARRAGHPARDAALRARELRAEPAAARRATARSRDEAGCTPAQLALAWLLAKASRSCRSPARRSVQHLEENLGAAARADSMPTCCPGSRR